MVFSRAAIAKPLAAQQRTNETEALAARGIFVASLPASSSAIRRGRAGRR